jgi:hypothetical protein
MLKFDLILERNSKVNGEHHKDNPISASFLFYKDAILRFFDQNITNFLPKMMSTKLTFA